MKKLITPIVHALLIIPLTAISVAGEFAARASGILSEWDGFIDVPIIILGSAIILIVGTPVFRLANRLMQRFEGLNSPGKYDHLRQSFFFYLIILYSISTWISRGFSGNEDDGYLLLWSGFSLCAIIVNRTFLSQK